MVHLRTKSEAKTEIPAPILEASLLTFANLRRLNQDLILDSKRDELAPPNHSITSSARTSSVGGTVMPSALAVLRLITRSNLVGCSTGSSAGLPPCSILTTRFAHNRNASAKETPYDIRPPASANGGNGVAAGNRCCQNVLCFSPHSLHMYGTRTCP